MNLGICCNARGDYEAAERYLKCSLEIFEEGNHSFLPKTIFNMAHVLCKDNRTTEAKVYVKKGISLAQMNNDVEYISKFNILQGLYIKEDKHLLDQCFAFFKSRQMYGDIEDFALEAAEYFRRAGRFEMASDYYHIVNLARTEIKKGEVIYENENDYLGIDDSRKHSYLE